MLKDLDCVCRERRGELRSRAVYLLCSTRLLCGTVHIYIICKMDCVLGFAFCVVALGERFEISISRSWV